MDLSEENRVAEFRRQHFRKHSPTFWQGVEVAIVDSRLLARHCQFASRTNTFLGIHHQCSGRMFGLNLQDFIPPEFFRCDDREPATSLPPEYTTRKRATTLAERVESLPDR